MSNELIRLWTGEVLEEEVELSLSQLCRVSELSTDEVVALVDQGLLEPRGPRPVRWRFQGSCVRRIRCAQRLNRDLGVNPAGAALALELLEEIDRLRTRLRRLEKQ